MREGLKDSHNQVRDLGYDKVRKVLPDTVQRGRRYERTLVRLLGELGYKKDVDYLTQKEIQYDKASRQASIREDFVFPDAENTETVFSSTHSHPTIPGHSNENKLHQAIGELWLLKTHKPSIRCVIFLGGEKDNWLSYVIDTIGFLYDGVIHAWDKNIRASLKTAMNAELKHPRFWKMERGLRSSYSLSKDPEIAPNSALRTRFFENVVVPSQGVSKPSEITNSLLREMANLSIKSNKRFWRYLRNKNTAKLWSERSIFNPPEVALNSLLTEAGFWFKSEINNGANSMIVSPNLLYDFGYSDCHRRTDFKLEAHGEKPVYIQCKSSGGGEGGKLTKHITDRSREQIARSFFLRCRYEDGKLKSKSKRFHWFYVLDGKWRTPEVYPLKYIHILEMCGVDEIYPCDELVDEEFEPNLDFKLLALLDQIGCRHSSQKSFDTYQR